MKDSAVKRRKSKGCNKYAIFKVSRQTTQITQTKDKTDKTAKKETLEKTVKTANFYRKKNLRIYVSCPVCHVYNPLK